MPKPTSNIAAALMSATFAAAPIALLSACTPNQPPSSTPGTTPSIWTGSPSPTTTPPKGEAESLTTRLKAPDGTQVAIAKFEFDPGYVRITVATTALGKLTPGFHGLHIHQVGKCEPDSVAPTGGPPGNFLSAGGHYQAPGHTGQPASGDLTSLEVRQDGAALLVTTTDAFTREDLLAGEKTALIIHAGADNFANIPPERYTQANGTPGPDETTLTTGDSGKRVACGVIGTG
ncbi:superoxide dismutase family protein [Mycobacterium sp. SM1]|uniref:superoxide dismutase[Cu-Zn] n=1 Tax=Mycobacterium sp. SM1 TaxID=2816243 RepID=UPI001BD13749|nr:superoxide dismutase family protein [Mycobacterium sp. SM1]MBS4728464.1 superoxide dismutase family protein [Mycobacterium sp. SM1]